MTEAARAPELIRLLRDLRNVRSFKPEPIPNTVVADIIDVVRWSGSAGNQQAWQVLFIEKRETLEELAQLRGYARHLAGAAMGAVIVSFGPRDDINAFDEGRLSERMMLAAAAHGVGSSIGWFAGEGREAARRLLGVPEGRVVRTSLSLGYPAEGALRGGRRKPAADLVQKLQ